MHHHNTLEMDQPREKWNKKRTSVKIRNGAPNHRANDIIVKEGNSQVVRIYYPPLFMGAAIEEGILETKTDCSAKYLLFLACVAFCVITFEPIMI